MLEMTYPDGEVLNYIYDTGGLLKQAYGTKRGNKYWYIKNLIYDEFGQRTRIEYGNGVYTTYTYDTTTRRLSHLLTVENAKKRTIQELSYTYDLVGNIMNTNNTAPIPGGGEHGGPTDQSFTYDNLYQLVTADGAHRPGENKRTTYNNRFAYDIIGNITWKFQNHKVLHGTDSATEPRETNYELKYIYDPISKPHAVRDAGDKLYTYDPNGNMLGWTSKTSGAKRTIVWNEENRVKSIADSGSTTVFLYNDAGERVVKRGQHGESVYLNRFYSVKNGDLGSKHIFAGETRIVTKLEKDGGSLQSGVPGSIALERSQGLQNAILQGNGQKKGIERRLTNPDGTPVTGTNPPIEKFQFFYHGDHLGSSSFITDDAGAVYQHLEYFPYGETWIESGGTGQMPYYRFTGKELDPETGLYYYGARYYDPVLSRWISADPALAKYLSDNNGGVQNSKNLNLYSYVHQNPIRLVDPNGEFVFAMEYNKDKQYGTIAIVWNGFFPDWIGRINTRADDGNGIRSGIYDYTVGTHPSAGGESNRYYTDQGQAYKALNLTKNGSSELPALRQKADGTMTYTGINAHAGNRMRFSQGWIDWMLKRPDASTGSSGCITICVTKDPKKTITQNDPSTWDNYSDFISSFPEGDQSKFILTRPGEAGGWFKEKVGQAAHWLEKALAPKKQSEE